MSCVSESEHDGYLASDWNIEDALRELTIQEKVSLVSGRDFWHTVPIPRLGIPTIRLSDGPNGIRGTKFFNSTPSSCLPCGTAIGATFDSKLVVRIGRLLAAEAKAKGAHVILGPTINIQRGPLGGRGFESFSEDPVLSGLTAASYCKGIKEQNIIPVLKHFVCNDQEHERLAMSAIVTNRALREIYLMPFMIAIKLSQPDAVMTAYNKVNGIHAAESSFLLQNVLRDEWKWGGTVISDWYGTYSTSEAMIAGLDLEMPGLTRWRGAALSHAISANKVSVDTLNQRVRNVLKLVKNASKSGIPDHQPEQELDREEDRQLLRQSASDSIVLLKNEESILPLDRHKRVLVIGPSSKIAAYCGGGSAYLHPYRSITPFEGISDQASAGVDFAQGIYAHRLLPQLGPCLVTEDGKNGFTLRFYNESPELLERKLLDTHHATSSSILLIDYEHPDLQELWYVDASGSFTPSETGDYNFSLAVMGTARMYLDGELIIDNVDNQKLGSSFMGLGTVEETYLIKLVAGRSYKILVQWGCSKTSKLKVDGAVEFRNGGFYFGYSRQVPQNQMLEEAIKLASEADQVVLCAGLSQEWESEGEDRTTMDLPPGSDELIDGVLRANPNTVVVIQSGTPVRMPWIDKAKAVLHAWYGGNETGHGIADVLFGNVNPSGKLPLTIPRRVQDNPTYLNYRSEGGRVLYGEDVYVGYRYYEALDLKPLFAFGHGLSYTTFSFSGLSLQRSIGSTDLITVQFSVTNTGHRAGAEVAQLYIQPLSATPVRRPLKELKEFSKVHLRPGESETVSFDLDCVRATSFWDEKETSWCSFAGEYNVLVGPSSTGPFVAEPFNIAETKFWTGL